MKYNFKGIITKYDERGNITNYYSYYTNEKKIDIDDLENILTLLANPNSSIDKEKIKKIIENIVR